MASVTVCSDFGGQENKISQYFHCLPIYIPWSDVTRCHDLSFLNVQLLYVAAKPTLWAAPSLTPTPHKEGWVLKNWCFLTVVWEKTLESLLDCKEIKAISLKENQLWIFIGRTDAETEAPILWPTDVKGRLIGKDPYAGKDWGRRIRGWQRMRWLDGITDSMDMSLGNLSRSQTRLSDWTELN